MIVLGRNLAETTYLGHNLDVSGKYCHITGQNYYFLVLNCLVGIIIPYKYMLWVKNVKLWARTAYMGRKLSVSSQNYCVTV